MLRIRGCQLLIAALADASDEADARLHCERLGTTASSPGGMTETVERIRGRQTQAPTTRPLSVKEILSIPVDE